MRRRKFVKGNKAVYLAIGLTCSGEREILGLWIEQTEGAKFWLRVMNELKGRGTEDILIAVVDGLKGFPDAITSVFPDCLVQTCIVHLLRYSMQFASWKERKALALALNPIYAATNAEAAAAELDAFEEGLWGAKYPAVTASWRRRWEGVIPFFAFSSEVRKIIYTTNAIEGLHSHPRRQRGTRSRCSDNTDLLRTSGRRPYRLRYQSPDRQRLQGDGC